MFKKWTQLFSIVITLFIVSACTTTSGEDYGIFFNETIDNVSFEDEAGGAYTFYESDEAYFIEGVVEGDIIIPVHDTATFQPDRFVVEEGMSEFTFNVLLEDDSSDDPGDNDDDDDSSDDPGDNDDDSSDDSGDNNNDDTDQDEDTPVERTKTYTVDDVQSFEEALSNPETAEIVLDGFITGDFIMDGIIDIDFADYILTGDLSINTEDTGTIELTGGTLDGNLNVDAENATLNNYLYVSGDTTISALATSSYYDFQGGNTVIIEASSLNATFHAGAESIVIASDNVLVHINEQSNVGTIDILAQSNNAVIENAFTIDTAIVSNETALFDSAPKNLAGTFMPGFTGVLIESIATTVDLTFEQGTHISVINSQLPNTIDIETEDGIKQVAVDWDLSSVSYNPNNENEQVLTVNGTFSSLDEALINVYHLTPEALITVEALTIEEVEITDVTVDEDALDITLNEVDTVTEIINLLPRAVSAVHDNGTTDVNVYWQLSEGSFDNDSYTVQTLTFTGTLLTLPQGYINPSDLKATIEVIIEPGDGLISDYHVYIGANYNEGVTITVSDDLAQEGEWLDVTLEIDQDYIFSHIEYYYTGEEYTGYFDPLSFNEFLGEEHFHIQIILEPVTRPDESTLYDGGSGTEEDPYKIATLEHLSNMRYYLDYGYYFELTNNIFFSEGDTFEPMRSENDYPFNGVLDGNGFTIDGYTHLAGSVESSEEGMIAFIRENEGIIKNLTFDNIEVIEDDYVYSGVLLYKNLEDGVVDNVSINGHIDSKVMTTFARFNYGLIKNVSADVTMINPQAGLVHANYGILRDSTITGTLTMDRFSNSGMAGVLSHNRRLDNDNNVYEGLVDNVHADLTIYYDVDAPSSNASSMLDIAGFAISNISGGTLTDYHATIKNSSADVEIINNGEHVWGSITGFIIENGTRGIIENSTSYGSLEGMDYLAGFVRLNRSSALIQSSTSYVDVYALEGNSAAFAHTNDSTWSNEGEILNSTAWGDVYSDASPIRDFIVINDGDISGSDGHGNTYDFPSN